MYIHIAEILARNAKLYPDEVALIERIPEEGRRWEITWKQFDERANRFANTLLAKGLKKGANAMTDRADREELLTGNNPDAAKIRPGFFRRLLLPLPHGVSATNRAEFAAFSKRRWIKDFQEAGFDLIAIRKGPAASGYGLGWAWADWIIEKMGLASELIYIAQKRGQTSRYAQYFL